MLQNSVMFARSLLAMLFLFAFAERTASQVKSDCDKLPAKPAKNFSVTLYSRQENKPEQIIRIERANGEYVVLTGMIGRLLKRTGDTILSEVPIRHSDYLELYEMVIQDKGFCEHSEDFDQPKVRSDADSVERYLVLRSGKLVRTVEIKSGRGLWTKNLVDLVLSFAARGTQ